MGQTLAVDGGRKEGISILVGYKSHRSRAWQSTFEPAEFFVLTLQTGAKLEEIALRATIHTEDSIDLIAVHLCQGTDFSLNQ